MGGYVCYKEDVGYWMVVDNLSDRGGNIGNGFFCFGFNFICNEIS